MTTINNISVTVDTTVPAISIGQIMLSADRRSTKEKPLTDAERIRRAVLPANHWGELATTINGERNQSLTDVLRNALQGIASDRLRDTLAAEPMQRTIELKDYTVPALLVWQSETAAGRGSITFTREQIENWYDNSYTKEANTAKWHNAGKSITELANLHTFVRNRFAATAAKNHGLKDASEATKLTALIDAADLDGKDASLMVELMGRLEAINKALTAKANEATISMDDL